MKRKEHPYTEMQRTRAEAMRAMFDGDFGAASRGFQVLLKQCYLCGDIVGIEDYKRLVKECRRRGDEETAIQ